MKLNGDKKIANFFIQNPFQQPIIQSLKATIIDIKATDERGNEYIIVMQVANVDGLEKRLQYYLAKGYTSQIEIGENFSRLHPIIFIGIFDFKFSQNPNYLSKHLTIDTETGENLFKDFEFNLIELPKFNKKETELVSIIDKWAYFIKNADNLEVLPENIEDDGLKAAYQSAQIHTWNKKELEEYEYAAMREWDGINREKFALKQGIKEVAKKLRIEGVDLQIIEKVTGFTKEEIAQIKT